MDPNFFPSLISWPAHFTLEGKDSVHNLPYGPRTRIIGGLYIVAKKTEKLITHLRLSKMQKPDLCHLAFLPNVSTALTPSLSFILKIVPTFNKNYN